jgi:hypothetical protein
MAMKAVDEARQGIAEVRQMGEECRRELGLAAAAPANDHGRRGLFRRGPQKSRRARREAPVV